MFVAHNNTGQRIWAGNAKRGEEYVCPVCDAQVVLKKGSVYAAHFAHAGNACVDTWHYDMSDWHLSMQALFPEECREVVVKSGGKTHRADVLIGNIAVEFQHSPISAEEFEDRCIFFRGAGYRLAWIFDAEKPFHSHRIRPANQYSVDAWQWTKPPRIFGDVPKNLSTNKEFSLWMAWQDMEAGADNAYLYKVDRMGESVGGRPSMSHFFTSPYQIDVAQGIDVDELFFDKLDHLHRAEENLKAKTEYSLKYIMEKGHMAEEYTCPITGRFGLRLSGANACTNCRYCAMIAVKGQGKGCPHKVYCCYPEIVRERIPDCDDDDYAYGVAPEYNI